MTCKFGASLDSYEAIVDICKKLNMILRGVSFHVGSGGCSFKAYENAILSAKNFF
jgi:diaminopimelate decarboxylase